MHSEIKLLVLAGGFGTRLSSVLNDVPKALATVGVVPFLYLQIVHWKNQGIKNLVFLLHHRADLIIHFLLQECKTGILNDCVVDWVVEPAPMGTGGAVAYAVNKLQIMGNFLVTNADTWLGTGIAQVSQANSPVLAVVQLTDVDRYGLVRFDTQFSVTSFEEKSQGNRLGWINAGLCQLNAKSFEDWDSRPFSLEQKTLPDLVHDGHLKAVLLETEFIDIGVPDDYFRFCRWIAADRKDRLCS